MYSSTQSEAQFPLDLILGTGQYIIDMKLAPPHLKEWDEKSPGRPAGSTKWSIVL